MKTIDLHMLWTLARASLIAIFALSVPVILISLNSQVQVFSIPASLLWPILAAISCIIIFHTMPILVTLAIIWIYARFWSEGIVVTLYMAGRSTLAVAAPALLVAMACTIAGYAIAGFLKPMSEETIHDVLHKLRREMDLNLINFGKFNYFDNGRAVIYIKKKINENLFEGIYMSRHRSSGADNSGYREHYYSRFAIISGNKENKKLVLVDGSMIDDSKKDKRFNFKYVSSQSNSGARASRSTIFFDELTTSDFLASQEVAFQKAGPANLWLREAVKRFVMPLLSLTHTLFALGLLNLFGAMMGRGGNANLVVAFVGAVMFAFHLPIVFLIEAISIRGLPLAGLVVALVALQSLLAVALFVGAQNLRLQTFTYSVLSGLYGLIPRMKPAPRHLPSPSFSK